MSLVAGGLHLVPDTFFLPVSVANSIQMDATGERIGLVRQITKSGNIRNVWVGLYTMTTADPVKVSLQGVGSDGLPDGTILGTGNAGHATWTPTGTGWQPAQTLGVDVAVTQGQWVAVVFEWNPYTDGNIGISVGTPISGVLYNFYPVTDITATPGTWVKYAGQNPVVILEYDDGTYSFGGCSHGTTINVSTSTTPDEIGNYFKSPYPFRAVGFYIRGDIDYDATLSLLDASGNVLANHAYDADLRVGTSSGMIVCMFDSNPAYYYDIVAGTYYRMVYTPGSTNNTAISYYTVPEAAAMGIMEWGADCVYTSRVDGGAWSQTDTRRVAMGLVATMFDDGAGSGGSSPRFGDRTGGLR